VGRRTFLKGAAATAGVATVGTQGQFGTARAALPLVPIGIAAGGAAVGYLAGEAADRYLGDDRDYSGYTGADALKTEISTGAMEMLSADERVMTSIQNNITTSQNTALAKGKAAVIEVMNAGGDESSATDKMQAAIDEYYATIQKNLLTHYEEQVAQIAHHIAELENHADTSAGSMIEGYDAANGRWTEVSGSSNVTDDVALLDGTTYTVEGFKLSHNFGIYLGWQPSDGDDGYYPSDSQPILRYHIEGQSDPQVYPLLQYINTWDSIMTERDDVRAQLSGFVSDVYAAYEPGDIPTEDLVDPITAATQLEQDYDHYATQGAHAAMLGIPTSAEQSVHMTIHDPDEGDLDVWADIFTNHNPTDADGNTVGFEVGTKYSPEYWDEPLYIAYEYVDEESGDTQSDFTQIESEFTINTIEDSSGSEVTNFEPESQNTQTADVQALKEELEQLREEQIRLQEEAQSDDDGGGFSFDALSFGGLPGEGVALGVAGLIALLVGGSDN
jgi:predicted ThiF/HesA family dinucleotide-utilizing enzyme